MRGLRIWWKGKAGEGTRTDEENEEGECDGHEGHRVAHEDVHRLLHVRHDRERDEAARVRHPVEPACTRTRRAVQCQCS